MSHDGRPAAVTKAIAQRLAGVRVLKFSRPLTDSSLEVVPPRSPDMAGAFTATRTDITMPLRVADS